MRKFRVVVNGQEFVVEVEELAGSGGVAPATPREPVGSPGVVAPVSAAVSASAPAPVAGPAAAAARGSEGTAVTAPLPGMVLDVKVRVGDLVKTGEIVAILEAMKMENEIPSPVDGKVVQVAITAGAAVNQDDLLVLIG